MNNMKKSKARESKDYGLPFRDGLDTMDEKQLASFELHDKIVRNDHKGCKALLKRGVIGVNESLTANLTRSKTKLTRTLIGHDVNAIPLHIACIYRKPKIVELLLQLRANPNIRDPKGHCAVQHIILHWPRVHCPKNEIEVTSNGQEYYEYIRMQHDKSKRCLALLCKHKANLNVTANGESLLHLAAKYNIVECVETLVVNGMDVDTRGQNLETSLCKSIELSNFEVAKEFVRLGANVNAKDLFGYTPLHYAVMSDKTRNGEHIRHLLKNGAKVNVQTADDDGFTALHIAAAEGHERLISILLNFGANPDCLDKKGESPLFVFFSNIENNDRIYGLEKLLDATTQINVLDNKGQLPLLLQSEINEHMTSPLLKATSVPSTLLRVCRQTIRRQLGFRRLNYETVMKLPCGKKLHFYILCNSNFFNV